MVGTWASLAANTDPVGSGGGASQPKTNMGPYPANSEVPGQPGAINPFTPGGGGSYKPNVQMGGPAQPSFGTTRGGPRPGSPIAITYQQPTPANAIQSLVDAYYGPQQLLLGQQLARQQDQLGLNNLNLQHNVDILNRDNALAQRGLGIDRRALGLEGDLARGQLGNLSRLRDILAKQRGLTREQFDNQLAGLKIDEAKVRDNASRETFDLRSNLTARGAFNTVANERGTGRIARDLMYQLGGIDNQRGAADIQFRNSLLGLDEKGIGYDNQQLALNNKLANIGLDGERLNLKGEQLNNALADGLWNSGMGAITNLNQILDAIGGTNQQQAQLGMEMLQTALQYSQLPPETIAALMSSLKPPTKTTTPPTRDPDKYAGR